MREKITKFIENIWTQRFILFVIVFNSIILGMMTNPVLMKDFGNIMNLLCNICVWIFTIEISIKLYVYKKEFFKDPWNIFDFCIVAVSWIPTGGVFSSFRVFRILRTLRALRLITQLERLRIIVQAIIDSIPNVSWASVLLLIIFYIFAIMGTTLYGTDFPVEFGTLGKSMFTLFQIMTLEAWADIARDVMAEFPLSWFYFVSFILVSSFIVMNVIVGVVVNAISDISDDVKKEKQKKALKDHDLKLELMKLKEQVKVVENLIELKNEN
jgi:voltage-gated sodium channel